MKSPFDEILRASKQTKQPGRSLVPLPNLLLNLILNLYKLKICKNIFKLLELREARWPYG